MMGLNKDDKRTIKNMATKKLKICCARFSSDVAYIGPVIGSTTTPGCYTDAPTAQFSETPETLGITRMRMLASVRGQIDSDPSRPIP